MIELTPKDITRFWSKVNRTDNPDECWEWVGTKRHSYGTIGFGGRRKNGGKEYNAHRVSYEINIGEIPDGLHVLHKCDNPKCVNPDHLFLGTHLDNMRDMFAKNRRPTARGENSGKSKLTDDQVREIRRRYKPYCHVNGTRALGREYNVTHECISSIVINKTWKHIIKGNES